MIGPSARVVLLAALCGSSVSCGGGGEPDGTGLSIAVFFTSPPPAGQDSVWLADGGGSGPVQLLEVVARDVTMPFDGFSLEIQFDPAVAEARDAQSGGALDGCAASLPVLFLDNVGGAGAGQANATGRIVISEAIGGGDPPGCTLAGTATLAHIVFRAAGRGSAPLGFVPFGGDPNDIQGTVIFRRNPDAQEVPATFVDGGATIEVRR